MKTFLLKNKKPLVNWGLLPDNVFFEGRVPEGYSLAICPGKGFIVLDVDRHGSVDGFDNIPKEILEILDKTFNYNTKNNGKHYWFKYTGDKILANKTSGLGFDLRVENKGYVVYYKTDDIRNNIDKIQFTTPILNIWLETFFSYK